MLKSETKVWLRPAEASQFLGISRSTLAKMRLRGDGPPYSKAGPRIVLYDRDELLFWLHRRKRRSTSDPGPGPLSGGVAVSPA